MNKEPFIINQPEKLQNLAQDKDDDFSFEFEKINIWQTDKKNVYDILSVIADKLDTIIDQLKKGGRE